MNNAGYVPAGPQTKETLVKKTRTWLALGLILALGFGLGTHESTAGMAQGVSTRMTDFPSAFADADAEIFPAVCDAVRIENKSPKGYKEHYVCEMDPAARLPQSATPMTEDNPYFLIFFSDFTGELASSWRFILTPNGRVVGTAYYN